MLFFLIESISILMALSQCFAPRTLVGSKKLVESFSTRQV